MPAIRRFPFFRLLFAACIGWLWYRSHARTDVVTLFLHRGSAQVIASDRGRVVLLLTDLHFGAARAYTYDYLGAPNDEFEEVRQALYQGTPAPTHLAGVWLAGKTGDLLAVPSSTCRMISIPFWELAVVAGIPLLLGLRTFWVRRLWGRAGICAGCGYDARFSEGRCPECGRELDAITPSSTASLPSAHPAPAGPACPRP